MTTFRDGVLRVLGFLDWTDGLHERLFDAYHHSKARTRSMVRAAKHQRNHIVKAIGLLITVSFAGASLYYSKAAAHDARCQLRLAQRQYCEANPGDIEHQQSCKEILDREMRSTVTCFSPGRYREQIFSVFGSYLPAYTKFRHKLDSNTPSADWDEPGTPPVPTKTLPTETPLWPRPRWTRTPWRPWSLTQEYSRCGDSLYSGMPWWHTWDGIYATEWIRPVLWRYPDAYLVADYFTGSQDRLALPVGLSVALLVLYRCRQKRDYILTVMTISLFLAPQIFSWWLLRVELLNQKRFWDGRANGYSSFFFG